MGWNGSGTVNRTDGTRSGASVWTDALAADEDVNAQDHDTHDEDLADAIENCVAKDGQNTPTANLPMGGYKHTGAASATADGQYVIFDQFAWTDWTPTLTPGGSMTYTSTTVNLAKYCRINDIVYFRLDFTGTIGGTPNNTMTFSLPVTATTDGVALTVNVTDNGSIVAGSGTYAAATLYDLYRYDSAVYTAATVSFRVHGFYAAA